MAGTTSTRFIGATLAIATAVVGCTRSPEVSPDVADRLCALSAAVASSENHGELNELLTALEKQFGVRQNKLQVGGLGVFVPTRSFFVEKSGLFVAKPGAVLPGKGSDPSFTPLVRCIYRYEIKG
jgi:hypothetical protein